MSNNYSLYLIDQCDAAVQTLTDQLTAQGVVIFIFTCCNNRRLLDQKLECYWIPAQISPQSKYCECKAIKMFVQSGVRE